MFSLASQTNLGGGAPGLVSETWVPRLFAVAFLALWVQCAHSQSIDCTRATVVSAKGATIPEQTAVTVLLEEVAKRTGVRWQTANTVPSGDSLASGCIIIAGSKARLPIPIPAYLRQSGFDDIPESFRVTSEGDRHYETIFIEGSDPRGLLYGIGYLLRAMEFSPGKAILPQQLEIYQSAPQKPIRGHQLGYRFKNNTYDAWTLAQFEQYIRELAIFGTNTIQLIAPESDDAPSSPLFPAPALETLIGTSKILDRYGLDCSIFYPEMEQDYARPEDTARELARFQGLFRQIPRVDSVRIPGGDPGHTPPNLLFPLVEREAAILHRYHPQAKIYVSAQGMNAEHFEDFYRLVAEKPVWLTGIFFGPQSRDSFETQRRRIPAQYPILFYPDIAHTMHAQFPIPKWDPVFALTEGREPIDPRPVDEAVIYKHFESLQDGFIAYSEGVNDDVNKFLWTQWSWDSATSAETILDQYSSFFLGPDWAQPFTKGLFDLERNWRGPIRIHDSIDATAIEFDRMQHSPIAPQNNWRFELALERAHYDAFLRQRLLAESTQQHEAIDSLVRAPQIGSEKALSCAEHALASLPEDIHGGEAGMRPMDSRTASAPEECFSQESPKADASYAAYRALEAAAHREQVVALADNLFHHIGLQLSTALYGASNWERGANLDRIDIPLNDRVWLTNQFARIRKLDSEAAKLQAIADITHWDKPGPGTIHVDLGSLSEETELERGKGFAADPELYETAIDGVSNHTPLEGSRWSQLTYAETLYETPLQLTFRTLDPAQHYCLRVAYGGEDYSAPIGILANGSIEIEPLHDRQSNPETLEFEIPPAATSTGTLTLEFTRPSGSGGSGRGHQVAEVWLIPES